ncbi:hypothetical protein GCM10011384_29920 [Psychrobacillus lasiicapitis]|nr:hypothetical protein GCM10011384_29920 [Psychrobacillus lasiicapitis]
MKKNKASIQYIKKSSTNATQSPTIVNTTTDGKKVIKNTKRGGCCGR